MILPISCFFAASQLASFTFPHFDTATWGWGHDFKGSGDHWESIQRTGRSWRFYGSQTDQGLWYYFARYVRKNVSIIIGDKLQNWDRNDDKDVELPLMINEVEGALAKYSPKPLAIQGNCDEPDRHCYPQANDVAHFMAGSKPWLAGTNAPWFRHSNNTDNLNAPTRLWFKELRQLSDILHLGQDIDNWNEKHANLKMNPPRLFLQIMQNTFSRDRN